MYIPFTCCKCTDLFLFCFQATWALIVEFCSNSSVHGVRYFTEKRRHWSERFVFHRPISDLIENNQTITNLLRISIFLTTKGLGGWLHFHYQQWHVDGWYTMFMWNGHNHQLLWVLQRNRLIFGKFHSLPSPYAQKQKYIWSNWISLMYLTNGGMYRQELRIWLKKSKDF